MQLTETEIGTWVVADAQVPTTVEEDEWIRFPGGFDQAYSTGMHLEARIGQLYLEQIEVRIDPSAKCYYILHKPSFQVIQLSTFTSPAAFKQTVESWVKEVNAGSNS